MSVLHALIPPRDSRTVGNEPGWENGQILECDRPTSARAAAGLTASEIGDLSAEQTLT